MVNLEGASKKSQGKSKESEVRRWMCKHRLQIRAIEIKIMGYGLQNCTFAARCIKVYFKMEVTLIAKPDHRWTVYQSQL